MQFISRVLCAHRFEFHGVRSVSASLCPTIHLSTPLVALFQGTADTGQRSPVSLTHVQTTCTARSLMIIYVRDAQSLSDQVPNDLFFRTFLPFQLSTTQGGGMWIVKHLPHHCWRRTFILVINNKHLPALFTIIPRIYVLACSELICSFFADDNSRGLVFSFIYDVPRVTRYLRSTLRFLFIRIE